MKMAAADFRKAHYRMTAGKFLKNLPAVTFIFPSVAGREFPPFRLQALQITAENLHLQRRENPLPMPVTAPVQIGQ